MLPQLGPGCVHVAHDDGDMLEPEVVAVRRHGNRPGVRRRDELRQIDPLLAELHADHPCAHAEETVEPVIFRSVDLHVADGGERQHVAVKGDGSVHVRHGETDGRDGLSGDVRLRWRE